MNPTKNSIGRIWTGAGWTLPIVSWLVAVVVAPISIAAFIIATAIGEIWCAVRLAFFMCGATETVRNFDELDKIQKTVDEAMGRQ